MASAAVTMSRPPLTSLQLKAAADRGPLTYVKAGPGSGKTRVVAEAFGHARYVRFSGDPRGVVAATFARSARSELASRVRHRWGVKSLGWPNAVCTLDDVHRQLLGHLVAAGLVEWPNGGLPNRVSDAWSADDGATRQIGQKSRYFVQLNAERRVAVFATKDDRLAPSPAFTDGPRLMAALEGDKCTHADIRNVLYSVVRTAEHDELVATLRKFVQRRMCQFIVDEAFDMNDLDVRVVKLIADAGVPVLLVGDPWQSLYEFRGATPRRVAELIEDDGWNELRMPGEHRYETAEMLTLATALFDGEWFVPIQVQKTDRFDVVIARDWTALWEETRIPVLPIGVSSKLDRSRLASCCVLVQHQMLASAHGLAAQSFERYRSEVGLDPDEGGSRLSAVLEQLSTSGVSVDDAWSILRDALQAGGKPWKAPGKTATAYMERMLALLQDGQGFLPGYSAHQAKGLEWDGVLLLEREFQSDEDVEYRLSIDAESHRSLYVALTRARRHVRFVPPMSRPTHGVDSEPIEVRRRSLSPKTPSIARATGP
jgi:DNA helicase II / ATP-dependent DNA helicase PcrA